ncbi:MAG: hypothetical protein H0Z55_05220 [Nitrosarchaeum sp.]|nr:hypothetical protein [Nitrosarchaeum sp.]
MSENKVIEILKLLDNDTEPKHPDITRARQSLLDKQTMWTERIPKILKRLNSAQTRRSIAQTTIDDSDYEIQLAHEDLLDAKEMLQKVQQWLQLYFPD